MNEWMNECLTTPQHEKQIGYWVSEKGKIIQQCWVLLFFNIGPKTIKTVSILNLIETKQRRKNAI